MERHYTITIENKTTQNNTPITPTTPQPTETPEEKASKGAKAIISGTALYGYSKALINTAVGHEISTYAIRTGQVEEQQKQEFLKEIVDSTVSIGEKVIGGAVLTGGNPIGIAVGLAIGVGQKVINLAQKQDTINLNRQVENATITLQNMRSGVGMSRGN